MIYEVSHRTSYAYKSVVAQSQHLVHLTPRRASHQQVSRHSLLIEPAPARRFDLVDYFGNSSVILAIDDEHAELLIHARSTVEVNVPPLPDAAATTPWEQVVGKARHLDGTRDVGVLQFAAGSRHAQAIPEAAAYGQGSFLPGRPILEAACDLTQRIHGDFRFDPTATDISTPVAKVFRQRRGVCQDFAHLAIACLRTLGLPARYVSGYILTRPPPGKEKLQGADASHAWLSVWAPETGWVGFDPTNGVMVRDEHVTVAYGRDYDDVSPISGVLLGGGDQKMTVAVDVVPMG